MATIEPQTQSSFPTSGPGIEKGFWMLPKAQENPTRGIEWPQTQAVTVAVDPSYVSPVLDRYPRYFKLILGEMPPSIDDRLDRNTFNVADALFMRKPAGAHVSVIPMQIGALIAKMIVASPSPIERPADLIEDLQDLARKNLEGVRLSGLPFLVAKAPDIDQKMEGSLLPETWSAAMAFKAQVSGIKAFYAAVTDRLGSSAMKQLGDAGLAFDPESLHATMAWTINRKFGIPLKDTPQIEQLTIVNKVSPEQVYPWTDRGQPIEPTTIVTNAAVVHALRKFDGATLVHLNDNVGAPVKAALVEAGYLGTDDVVTDSGRAFISDPRIGDVAFFGNIFVPTSGTR
jgi:hypothetical protein